MRNAIIGALLAVLLLALPGTGAPAEEASVLTLPNSVETVETEAFAGSGAHTVVVTSGVKTIESRAFADCEMLSDVVLPNHDVTIADDAFDGCGDLYFHAFAGTKNELWALSHGYACEALDADMLGQASAMLTKFGIPSSSLQGNSKLFATCCLIVKTENGINRLPNITQYHPTDIIQAGKNRFFVQFDSPADTEACYDALTANLAANNIQYVEIDQYFDAIDTELAGQQSVAVGWSSEDPMGFQAYSDFVAEEGSGSVTVAVLDSGFPSNAAYNDKMLSDQGVSFARDGNPWTYDGCNHGRLVAAVVADCTGNANVNILPIRVADSRGRVDTISLVLALEYAAQQGASIVNMSIGFEDPGFSSRVLEEAISAMRGTVVVAAGNFSGRSRMNYFPARHPSVIAVSAVNPGYTLASYSCVDGHFAAPGSVSAAGLSDMGTSFAAPQIAAALALVDLDPSHGRAELTATCQAVAQTTYGMPNLSKLAKHSVVSIEIKNVPDTFVLGKEDFALLECTVLPQDATDKTFTFESSNPSVVYVNKNSSGIILVTALKKGTATLTVRSNDDPSVMDEKVITVVKPVASITLSDYAATTYIGRELNPKALVEPADASNPSVIWSSSDPSVAEVDRNTGKITPKRAGETTVFAEAADGYGAAASFTLTVETLPLAESIAIDLNGVAQIGVGDTLQAQAIITPADALQDVKWSSLFAQYATMDENGMITAVSPGTAIISAQTKDGSNLSDYFQLTVLPAVESVTVSAPSDNVNQGTTMLLTATVSPSDAIDTSVYWESSDPSIATVGSDGMVEGISDGEVQITAYSNKNPGIWDSVTVRVYGVFQVSFNLNADDASSADPLTKQALRNVSLGDLPVPTRPYYQFAGWYLNAEPLDGEEPITRYSSFDTNEPVTLYAAWELNPISGWVTAAQVPSNSELISTSWSYRESTETTASTLSGWNSSGSYWSQTGNGSKQYASLDSRFSTSHWIYTSLNGSPYTASETATTKREVSNSHAGWIYWHWAYNAAYYNNTSRWISDRSQQAPSYGGSSEYYGYVYFYAFTSTVDCPTLDSSSFVWGANGQRVTNQQTYNCANALPSGADTSSRSGLNNPRFLRTEYFNSYYTDYQKIFQYYRDVSYASADPGDGSNISNKVQYYKYRPAYLNN